MVNHLKNLRYLNTRPLDDDEVREALSYGLTYRIQFDNDAVVLLDIGRRPEMPKPPADTEANEESAADAESAEPEMEPAGTVFAKFRFPDDSIWATPSASLAFEVSSYNFEQLPGSRSDLFDTPEALESQLPPGLAPLPSP